MDTVKKLAKISEVMADGYQFLKIMQWVQEWENLAEQGDENAKEMMQVLDRMYKMCVIAQRVG